MEKFREVSSCFCRIFPGRCNPLQTALGNSVRRVLARGSRALSAAAAEEEGDPSVAAAGVAVEVAGVVAADGDERGLTIGA